MEIRFVPAVAPEAPIVALAVEKDAGRASWAGLEEGAQALATAAAKAQRFEGEAGSLVELFVQTGGTTRQLLLLGVGAGSEVDWEKAGGALTAKLLTSGATEVVA